MSVTNGQEVASREGAVYVLQIYPGLSPQTSYCALSVPKEVTAAVVIREAGSLLGVDSSRVYVLVEVREPGGEEWVLEPSDLPVQRVLMWPRRAQNEHPQSQGYYFVLLEQNRHGSSNHIRPTDAVAQRLVARGLCPPELEDFDDLCHLPLSTEADLLACLRSRFRAQKIYTYAGNILVALNPFKFLPIYNPKYVKMYEKQQLGRLPPHIFAVADVAYNTMLQSRVNQCIIISGESGSGKTQSTSFLVHCLTALSQKGHAGSTERTILGAGPVLEAFGNAKTAHNDNSSRFGKFIQVNYTESGTVRGAVVEKYLLEKSRLVTRDKNERNYHVFYYLLVGASEEERMEFKLLQPEDYHYLQQSFPVGDEDDLRHEYKRLHQAMEMVGFLPATKKQIFSVISAILYLGNVTYELKSTERDEELVVGPSEVLGILSDLLKVKEELLVEALTKRRTVTANDTLILPYSHSEAITARDSMAKSLYTALFDWIVLCINHAIVNKRDMEDSVMGLSIGVLDIFGFEDFKTNSFEQFCINYANEQLQYYFNQYVFKLEQEEYKAEGIAWHNIDYNDNVGCIHLISKKPTGLFHLLDEESNFPHATDKTLLAKFKSLHHGNPFFISTPVMEPAFVILHFAGKVKYQLKDFREKNTDHMRPDIVSLLRSSNRAYVRQLIGMDPVAMFRWGLLRAVIRSIAAFNQAGRRRDAEVEGVRRRGSRTPLLRLKSPFEKTFSCGSPVDFSFDRSMDRPMEVFEDIFASYENKKKSRGIRQKQIIPKNLVNSRSLKFILSLTLHDRTTRSLLLLHKKKKPPSITAQFQASLGKLLETLKGAEPFFIRCIRSNAKKMEMYFDESLVLQQLQYTGMLETVCIRRSGYSAKYTFQEFSEQFQVLLPRRTTSPQEDFSALLQKMGMESSNYQIGKTKVFLKETERQQLLETRHRELLRRIVFLQNWFRACLERRNFLRVKKAAIVIQRSWRRLHEDTRYTAATLIQAMWRGSQKRAEYLRQRASMKKMEVLVRGSSAQQRYQALQEERRRAKEAEDGRKRAEEEEWKVGEGRERKEEGGQEEWKVGEKQSLHEGQVPHRNSDETQARGKSRPPITVSSAKEGEKGTDLTTEKPQTSPVPNISGSWSQERMEFGQPESQVRAQEKVGKGGMEQNQSTVAPGERKEEKRKKSSPNQARPYSLPPEFMSSRDGSLIPATGSLQRYSKQTLMKEKAEKWKERRNEGGQLDNAGLQPLSQEERTTKAVLTRGISLSLNNLPDLSSSGSDSSGPTPSIKEVSVNNRKRRIAHARSGLMFNNVEANDMEFWSFPLPPISPGGPPSRSANAQPQKPQSPSVNAPEGSKVSNPKTVSKEGSDHTSPIRSPESLRFIKWILRKRTNKELQASDDGELTPTEKADVAGSRTRRNYTIKISRATRVSEHWNASLDRRVTDARELQHLDEFLGNQVNDLRSRGKKLSETESIFIMATLQFRETIKGLYTLSEPRVWYRELMKGYQKQVTTLAGEKQKTEVQLVNNLFQSVLDGFIRGEIKREEPETDKKRTPQPTKKRKIQKKEKCAESPLDHMFSTYQVNIMQSCDQCSSYIWGMEKACMCSSCKMACHKKCLSKITKNCSSYCVKGQEAGPCTQHFGVHLCALTRNLNVVPVVMEMLLVHVELNGIDTEGIYRKSGAANRAKELRQRLEKSPQTVCLEDYPIHTVTGVVKQWLRELPDPLMTYTHYNDFLHAVELPEKSEKLHAIYELLEQLPAIHFLTLQRLISHLVRVAKEEKRNRMSSCSLAIVFAPCILRTPDTSDPLMCMKDVGKTTMCLEMLLDEQMKNYKKKLEEVEQLEYAEALAVKQLKLERQNTVLEKAAVSTTSSVPDTQRDTEVEQTLLQRIRSIKQEKNDLTYRLLELSQDDPDSGPSVGLGNLHSDFYDSDIRYIDDDEV